MFGALISGLITGVVFTAIMWGIDMLLCRRNSKSPSDYTFSTTHLVIGAAGIAFLTGLLFMHGIFWMIGCGVALFFGYRFLQTNVWKK